MSFDPRAAKLLEMRRLGRNKPKAPKCGACFGPLNGEGVCRRCHPELCAAPPAEKARPEAPKLRVEPDDVVLPPETPPEPIPGFDERARPGPQGIGRETLDEVRGLALQGLGVDRIAGRLGLRTSAVAYHLSKMRERGEIPPPTPGGRPAKPAAEPTAESPAPPPGGRRKTTRADVERTKELTLKGYGVGRIARITGMSQTNVDYHRRKLVERGELSPAKPAEAPAPRCPECGRRLNTFNLRCLNCSAEEKSRATKPAAPAPPPEPAAAPAPDPEPAPEPIPEPAVAVAVPEPAPVPDRSAARTVQTEDRLRRVVELRNQGRVLDEIAQELGVSFSSAERLVRKAKTMGLLGHTPYGVRLDLSVGEEDDHELAALRMVLAALRKLTPAGRTRVMEYAAKRMQEKES